MTDFMRKKELLLDILKEQGKIAVAFSGGVDSSFLLAAAKTVGEPVALTVSSVFVPKSELTEAAAFCQEFGVEQKIIELNPLSDKTIAENNPRRCYYCKRRIFTALLETAKEYGAVLIDGTNADDAKDYRPGLLALDELGVLSPLKAAGLTKTDIRALSREMNLSTAAKPSKACLASRIPYGETLTKEKLARVERAEDYLLALGLTNLRVRAHGDIARIEVDRADFAKLIADENADAIVSELKSLGFTYVTLDLAGFKSGSMNARIVSS